jgi:hypothetical protein
LVKLLLTEKSEATAMYKEMPVIPVNKVVDKKRIIGKRRAEEGGRGSRGSSFFD